MERETDIDRQREEDGSPKEYQQPDYLDADQDSRYDDGMYFDGAQEEEATMEMPEEESFMNKMPDESNFDNGIQEINNDIPNEWGIDSSDEWDDYDPIE